ncbi:MAG: NAD(P)-dependent dehydrogenase (short-subunit alcohol dehydrogenase family) [Cyclobacteriaceae bacterium]|jgi:3-oxoacyl-[acyl-carrier protein] reductase
MENNWTNKTAIITGGGGGLGLATAKKLQKAGVNVVLFDNRRETLDKAKGEFVNDILTYEVDVTNYSIIEAAVLDVAQKFPSIDILINAAGITGQTNIKSHEVSLEDFEKVWAINVKGSLITFKAVAPFMLKQNYGRVLNVTSIAGKEGNAGMVSYSSAKAAVIGMTKSQGKEYAETGIKINSIAPAVIRTKMVAAMSDEQVKYMTDKIPMKRCGELDEFADMAMFIVSEENSFSTGFTFDLSGGRAVY